MAGTAVADGAIAIDCALTGTLPGVGEGLPGVGAFALEGETLVVVDSSGSRIGTSDPHDPLTARLSGCIRQGFVYRAEVVVENGRVRIDVEPAR